MRGDAGRTAGAFQRGALQKASRFLSWMRMDGFVIYVYGAGFGWRQHPQAVHG